MKKVIFTAMLIALAACGKQSTPPSNVIGGGPTPAPCTGCAQN
jgi:hypothetical protein